MIEVSAMATPPSITYNLIYYYDRIADCTCCGKLSGRGMDTKHHSKDYASCESTDNHLRHVGIESAIGMLMEFNIGRNRKPGHRASQPYPVYDQSAGCECGEKENDQFK